MRLLLVACATTTARALSTSSSVRLDKFLNDASVAASRAACSKLVKQGRVAVDGVVAKRAAAKVPADARVTVDDVVVDPLPLLWAYHKPVGVHSTLSDDRGRPDLAAVAPRKAHPVGRLDADTSGLLLFSSDGALTHKLLSPRAAVEKEYVATCEVADGADAALARTPEAFLRDRLAVLGGVEVDLTFASREAPDTVSLRTATPTQRRPACRRRSEYTSATCWRRGSPPTTASR